MIPAKKTETGGDCPRRGPRAFASGVVCSVVATLLLASASVAIAQEKPLQIGVLALGPRKLPVWQCGSGAPQPAAAQPHHETMPFYVRGLLDELEKLKYLENRPDNAGKPGRRFVLDLRMGTPQELRSAAREFVRKRVDVIVGIATTATRIAQEESKDNPIPILFPGISDPVGDGFVQSLARPGGFITGVSHQQVQGSGKRVELFKEMVPGLKRMITLRRPGYGPAEKSMPEIRATTGRSQIEVLDWTFDNRGDLQALLAKVSRETADGFMILPDSAVISNMDLVLERSLEQGVPTFGLQDFMADWGAIGAYGPSAYQAGGRLAGYIDKISKGAKPGEMPVEPTDPTLVINLKAAACLGVPVPLTVLQQADRIIR
jgi:putative ABC transport system substrate-binding protein